MTDKEKLIELLEDTLHEWECEVQPETLSQIAEHLIENGVIIPLCKPGDIVYVLYPRVKYIEKYRVVGINLGEKHDTIQFAGGSVFTIWDKKYNEFFGKTIFLTIEEAEKARMELKQ